MGGARAPPPPPPPGYATVYNNILLKVHLARLSPTAADGLRNIIATTSLSDWRPERIGEYRKTARRMCDHHITYDFFNFQQL